MAARHYGLDVSLFTIGTKDLLGTFESMDFNDDANVKESQAAQDTGPNKRIVGADFTISLNKFVEGNSDFCFDYLRANRESLTLIMVFKAAGAGTGGATFRTLTITNCLVSKLGLNVSGDATKETIEITRGTGGDYTLA